MSTTSGSRGRRVFLLVLGVCVAFALLVLQANLCLRAWLLDGIVVPECPDGALTQTVFVDAWGLRRGAEGVVRVGALAHYTVDRADLALSSPIRRVDAKAWLVKPGGEEVPLVPAEGWSSEGSGGEHAERAVVVLPEVPDGEYVLRARVSTPLGEGSLDVPLPVLAPARIHVITDRPLYEPGNTVHFRAVALRARDLVPLDGRPGRFLVEDPSGEVVLEEKAPAGDFGVASGSFPLDAGAPTGTWRVRWASGAAEDAVSFQVEPFTLPRFRVEASAPRPYYLRGERPVLRGKVVYSSGAPVRGATLEISWSVRGGPTGPGAQPWPPPADWLTTALPQRATAGASGDFELLLPVVPGDLRGRVTVFAHLSATDSAHDRAAGSAEVTLSEDAIQLSAVTELDEGLVQGFNNRVYLRATTAAGAVLAGTELVVKRAWEPSDPGVVAKTDEDGVAALQLDPGPPVNVVIPPMPYRPPPRPPAVARGEVTELLGGDGAPLADQLVMDGWNRALAPCARFVDGSGSAQLRVGLHVEPSGAIAATAGHDGPLSRCARELLRGFRLPAGRARVYSVELAFTSDLPDLDAELEGSPRVPAELEDVLPEALLDARRCLPHSIEAASLPRLLVWRVDLARRAVSITFADDPDQDETTVPEAVVRCVEARLQALTLRPAPAGAEVLAEDEVGDSEPATSTFLGVARLAVVPAGGDAGEVPQATTLLGYELAVTARAKDEILGSTRIFLSPGSVPDVRLRPSTVLAEAGQRVDVTILRGPSFSGELPEKLWMSHEQGTLEAKVDPKTRTASFELPASARGWFETSWLNGRALIYVRPKASLEVAVSAGADEVAPGQQLELLVSTRSGGSPARAAVGLIGVDSSLGQLAPLPGPDDLARVRPKAEMRSPAFGVLDAAALALGRVRGANASAATVLRVSSVPAHVELDASINASARPPFEPLEALTDHFYTVLTELHARAREWEERAPKDEQMTPRTMARLWEDALRACEARKEPVTDAYGRRLRLGQLPEDLLALTDPRAVVIDGARLPEDIENWGAWVAKERP